MPHLHTLAAGTPAEGLTELFEELRLSLVAASLALRCVEIGLGDGNLVRLAASDCEQSLLHLREFAVHTAHGEAMSTLPSDSRRLADRSEGDL